MKHPVTKPKQTLYGLGNMCLTGWVVYLKKALTWIEGYDEHGAPIYEEKSYAIFSTKLEARLFSLRCRNVQDKFDFKRMQGIQ